MYMNRLYMYIHTYTESDLSDGGKRENTAKHKNKVRQKRLCLAPAAKIKTLQLAVMADLAGSKFRITYK